MVFQYIQYCTVDIQYCISCIHALKYMYIRNEMLLHLQNSIAQFLEGVHLEEYLPQFNNEGYSTHEDIEHMIGMTRDDFRNMGITKRGVYTIHSTYTLTHTPHKSRHITTLVHHSGECPQMSLRICLPQANTHIHPHTQLFLQLTVSHGQVFTHTHTHTTHTFPYTHTHT